MNSGGWGAQDKLHTAWFGENALGTRRSEERKYIPETFAPDPEIARRMARIIAVPREHCETLYPKKSENTHIRIMADYVETPVWACGRGVGSTALATRFPGLEGVADMDELLTDWLLEFLSANSYYLLYRSGTGELLDAEKVDIFAKGVVMERYIQLNWKLFHLQGLWLARRVKAMVGDRATITYEKPVEDPDYRRREKWLIIERQKLPDYDPDRRDWEI